MGWLWSSSQSVPTPGEHNSTSTSSKIQQPSHRSSSTPDSAPAAALVELPKRQLSRDEQAELEFKEAMREAWEETSAPVKPLPKGVVAPRHAPPRLVPDLSHDPMSIHPTNLYPRELSCRALFDLAYGCQSMGGQFLSVYRIGKWRDCKQQWANFWFCMRTNNSGYSGEQKIQKIKQHYWEREEKYRKGASSEDVWSMREHLIQDPFPGNMEELENSEYIKKGKEYHRKLLEGFVAGTVKYEELPRRNGLIEIDYKAAHRQATGGDAESKPE